MAGNLILVLAAVVVPVEVPVGVRAVVWSAYEALEAVLVVVAVALVLVALVGGGAAAVAAVAHGWEKGKGCWKILILLSYHELVVQNEAIEFSWTYEREEKSKNGYINYTATCSVAVWCVSNNSLTLINPSKIPKQP